MELAILSSKVTSYNFKEYFMAAFLPYLDMKYSIYILDKHFSLVMENRWSNTIQSADTTLLLVSWTSCKCNYIKTKVINNNIYLLIRVLQYRTKKLKKIIGLRAMSNAHWSFFIFCFTMETNHLTVVLLMSLHFRVVAIRQCCRSNMHEKSHCF